ncbi:hypothetical protein P4S72_29640 [Vibrio sp. PP-XX7]
MPSQSFWRALFAIDGVLNHFLGIFGVDPISWLGEPSFALFTITLLRAWQFGSAMVIFLSGIAKRSQIPIRSGPH